MDKAEGEEVKIVCWTDGSKYVDHAGDPHGFRAFPPKAKVFMYHKVCKLVLHYETLLDALTLSLSRFEK